VLFKSRFLRLGHWAGQKTEYFRIVYNKQKIELLNVPDVRQSTSYTCGPSLLQAILMYYGIEKREDILAQLSHSTPEKGSTPKTYLMQFTYWLGKYEKNYKLEILNFTLNKRSLWLSQFKLTGTNNQFHGKTVGTMGIMLLLLATIKTIFILKTQLNLAALNIFQQMTLY